MSGSTGLKSSLRARCNRFQFVVWALFVALGALASWWPPEAWAQGCSTPLADVNANGVTDVSDVQCLLLAVLADIAQAPGPSCVAPGAVVDVDCNGSVHVSDVQVAILSALGTALGPLVDPDLDGCPDACQTVECVDPPTPAAVSDNPMADWFVSGPTHTISNGGFTDDLLGNADDTIRVGTRRQWGCTVVQFGLTSGGGAANTIDANDTGREVQIALYDPTRIKQGCAHNASCVTNPETQCPNSITYLGWNPVQGGNECNQGSPIDAVKAQPGLLECAVRPFHWNPDWQEPTCVNNGCSNPAKAQLGTDIRYTQRMRFVDSHIVQMEMVVENLADISHPVTHQEFPTMYVGYGANGLGNYRNLLTPTGQKIPIDIPANDGFFYRQFVSDGPWVTLQNDAANYGVGIYYENRLKEFQGWQKAGVFNNTRAVFPFGIPALGTVRARAYLVLGSFSTVKAKIEWLDQTLPPFGHLETPMPDQMAYATLEVRGWALDNKAVAQVELRVDGAVVQTHTSLDPRPDVCEQYPGYAACPAAGFQAQLSTAALSACEHRLDVVAKDFDGNERVIAATNFTVSDEPLCGGAADCDDGELCTVDLCEPTTGCSHAPVVPGSLPNPPAEVCNGEDDDCDGLIDEVPECAAKLPVHRFYWTAGSDADHAYGLTATAPAAGFVHEGVAFYLRDQPAAGWVPLYQVYCPACTDHMLSLSSTEGAPSYGGAQLLGYCRTASSPEAPLHLRRLWSAVGSDHFSSTSPAEWQAAQAIGYSLEGGCYVPAGP